jgi:hypothetical protein
MKQVANSTLLTLLLLVPASVSAQNDVGVYVTGPDLQTKELEFKVVEGQKVKSGFQVKPESVVQVSQGGNLLVVTEPRNNVDSVKITDGSGRITKLVNTNGDTFSLSGIAPGVYTLDAIVNMPNSGTRAAYETILVILSPGQSPQDPTQIIQKVKIVTDVRVTFEDVNSDDGCSNKPGSAGLKFPQDKRTECEKIDYDECEKKGFKTSGGFCDNIYELFWDDDCFGFENAKECNDYANDRDAFCVNNPNHKKCPKPIPPCDQDNPTGQLCRDDRDEITCDGREVPRGNECVDPCIENPGSIGCPAIPEDPVEPDKPIVVTPEPDFEEEEDDNEDSNGDPNGNGNSGSAAEMGVEEMDQMVVETTKVMEIPIIMEKSLNNYFFD